MCTLSRSNGTVNNGEGDVCHTLTREAILSLRSSTNRCTQNSAVSTRFDRQRVLRPINRRMVSPVKVGTFNARSVATAGKSSSISTWIAERELTVVGLVETWHDGADSPALVACMPPGYVSAERARPRTDQQCSMSTNHGGVCLLYRDRFHARIISNNQQPCSTAPRTLKHYGQSCRRSANHQPHSKYNIRRLILMTHFVGKVQKIHASTAVTDAVSTVKQSDVELSTFQPVTSNHVLQLLRKTSNKHCPLDPAPTWLVKKSAAVLSPVIAAACNASLKYGLLPLSLKQTLASARLKKPSLDPSDLHSFCPISNFSFF